MNDWDSLNNIVEKWERRQSELGAPKEALDKLAESNIHLLARELCQAEPLKHDDRRAGLFRRLFAMARRAVENQQTHSFWTDLAEIAGRLSSVGVFFPDALHFLGLLLERYATGVEEPRQAQTAFDSILAGVNSKDRTLADEFVMALSLQMPRLSPSERSRFITAVQALPKGCVKPILLPSLKSYNKLQQRAEKALRSPGRVSGKPRSVISIHSHKGGVGKTTIAVALAVELARDGKRVCVVDCDDEGPSLFQSLPRGPSKQKDISFLADWLTVDSVDLPKRLHHKVRGFKGKISSVLCSFLDVAALDNLQRGKRPPSANYTWVQQRMEHLIHALIERNGFNCVILDTGPGLAHLALDVLMATLAVGGSNVFVMRPRVVDIAQFCVEVDWLWHMLEKERCAKTTGVVLNFTRETTDPSQRIDLKNPDVISERIVAWPGFEMMAGRYFTSSRRGTLLQKHIRNVWKIVHAQISQLPERQCLRHVDALDRSTSQSAASVIQKDDLIPERAREILSSIGWCPAQSKRTDA